MSMPAGKKYVGPRGNPRAKIMVVGEAPGAHEERLGQPFVGPSGGLLEECLLKVGIDPNEVFFTNICKYRPPNNELRQWYRDDGTPTEPIINGLEELITEIESVNPNVIIPLGNYPHAHLTGKGRWSKKNGYTGIGDYRGYVLEGSPLAGGRKCIPSYHPASILREYSNKPIFKLDLRRASTEAGTSVVRRPHKFFILDPRGDEHRAWTEWLVSPENTLSPPFKWNRGTLDGREQAEIRLPSGPYLSADIENPGNKLVCCGLSRHPDIGVCLATYNEVDRRQLRDILCSGIPLCWQNGMFDASILHWYYDIDTYPFIRHDTFLMMHTVYTEMPRDLGFIASVHADNPPPWWQHIDSNWWKTFGPEKFHELLGYNCYDHSITLEAALKMLSDELSPDGPWRETYEFEMSLVYPLYKVSRRGVKIDTKTIDTLKTTLEEEAETMNWALATLNENRPLNVKSPIDVPAILFKLGLPEWGLPKAPSSTSAKPRYLANDKVLADVSLKTTIQPVRQAISFIRGIRERRDLVSKFCNIELDTDGRMRCHYDIGKTQTRRLASRAFYPTGNGANLQNIPKDDRVRAVFIPDDGYVFGYADLKSAESLIVAHLSGDPEMLRLHSPEFMTGGKDGHKFVAAFLFGKAIEDITSEERYIGKRTRHACNYMLGWMKLMQYINADADTTGVSVNAAAAKQIVAKYRQFHPLLVQWWGEIESELAANGGWLADCFDNRHQFYGRREEILPNAVAFKPQGTVGVLLNKGLVRADRNTVLNNLDFQIILQVHDAIGFQVPRENVRDCIGHLVECMTVEVPIKRRGVDDFKVTIPVDVKLGYNWGEFDKKEPEVNPRGLRGWETFLTEGM